MKVDFRYRTPASGVYRALAAVTGVAAILAAATAAADDITFAVIGPHEYDLPVNYQPFNALVQYGEWNDNHQSWGPSGNSTHGPGGSLYEGLTKYVYFFDIESIPDVGFAYEVIQPEVILTNVQPGVRGFGDTLTGPAVWFKPTPQSTLGFQNFVQLPIGERDVTSDAWGDLASIFFDYQWPVASITGDIGAVLRGREHISNAPDIDQSTAFHTNIRATWKTGYFIEPFLAFDWQTADHFHNAETGQVIPNSGANEVAFGGGLQFNISENSNFSFRYSHGVAGNNTTVTDAIYTRLQVTW
jgi:hypothetical protein